MQTPSEFDKSVFGSVVVMLLVYICVAVPGYYYMGNGSVYLMDALKGHAASNGTANAFISHSGTHRESCVGYAKRPLMNGQHVCAIPHLCGPSSH